MTRLAVLLALLLSGCATVAWTPRERQCGALCYDAFGRRLERIRVLDNRYCKCYYRR